LLCQLADRLGERLRGSGGAEALDDAQQGVRGGAGIADQPDKGEEGDRRREHREHPVVGECRRPVGAVVVLELGDRALEHPHP
jgi:hypothetical protein